jgi:hypothetical protein
VHACAIKGSEVEVIQVVSSWHKCTAGHAGMSLAYGSARTSLQLAQQDASTSIPEQHSDWQYLFQQHKKTHCEQLQICVGLQFY